MADEKKIEPATPSKKMEKKEKSRTVAKKTAKTKRTVAASEPKANLKVEKKKEDKSVPKVQKVTRKEKTDQELSPKVTLTEPSPQTPTPTPRHPSKRGPAPRRHLVDLSEIKPTTKYVTGLKGRRSIVGLTAYDAIMSKLIAKAGVDFILVGDSVGTTLLGYDTTIPVTIDDMVHHTAAVRRGQPGCLVVSDLPFGEASLSFDRLLDSARRLMQNGADAVKIEGGKDVADDIEKLVATGIPVMGHIGLLPQTVKSIGGYRKFGIDPEEADNLYTDAISLEEAGCFAVIAEMMDEQIATQLAGQILPPLIGIGSGDQCDGQILVTHDLLGLTPSPLPSFVNPCATLGLDGLNALSGYVQKTRSRQLIRK